MNAGDARVLLRGYLVATAAYVAGHVALWTAVYRHGGIQGARERIAYAIAAVMCIIFVAVAARLAASIREPRVLGVAAVLPPRC